MHEGVFLRPLATQATNYRVGILNFKPLILLGIFLSTMAVQFSAQAQVFESEQIEVELISETSNVVAGETLWLAIRLKPIEHWHTYWKFGGDSGQATEASDWQLPEGATAGEITWPMPEWTPFLGSDLITFAYGKEVYLPIPVTVPADLTGDRFEIATTIDWQVCDEICIPGSADFALSLPIGGSAQIDPQWQQAFADTRAEIPLQQHSLIAEFNTHDEKVNIMVRAQDELFSNIDEAYFFPDQRRILKYAPFRKLVKDGDRLQIAFEQPRRFDQDLSSFAGVLAFSDREGNWQSYELKPQRSPVAWDHSMEVELLSEVSSVSAGETIWLGLRLDPKEHWHTYWKMGGDSGEPTSLSEWTAPEGSVIGEIQWPAPHWLPFYDTDLVNFGYEEQVLLPVSITLPDDLEGDTVEISTLAFWNVCDQICIPGEQRLSITLPITAEVELDATRTQIFAQARAQLPVVDHELSSLIAVAGERVSLGFESPEPLFSDYTDAYFFPEQRRVIKLGPMREVAINPNLLQITHQQPRRMLSDLSEIYGVLVLENEAGERKAFDFVNPAVDANSTTITPFAAASNEGSGGAGGTRSIFYYLFGALLGGLILNLMPCVFPVLSLKALSFAANSGESKQRQRMDGLVYTLGVVVAFVVLASLLIALRAGGERIGWAFQFQQPWFVALLVYLFFMMALSMSGVFEIGTSFMGVGGSLAEKKGYKGSFFTGVLATVVATPCTAPFMGPAIGFALSQTWIVAMSVFISLGLGLALPILILSFSPALSRFMPRPGAWMVTFKEFMAFPLYATALWLLWTLGMQVGVMGMSAVIGACILLAFGVWLYQKRTNLRAMFKVTNAAVSMACVIIAIYVLQSSLLVTAPVAAQALDADGNSTLGYEVFSTQRLADLRAEGKTVFVNMTAAWCITCLANEQTTLGTERVKQVMKDNNIVYMKGDWTNENPEITDVLEQFNQPSVPLYVLFPADQSIEPIKLPQILTPGIVTEIFTSI